MVERYHPWNIKAEYPDGLLPLVLVTIDDSSVEVQVIIKVGVAECSSNVECCGHILPPRCECTEAIITIVSIFLRKHFLGQRPLCRQCIRENPSTAMVLVQGETISLELILVEKRLEVCFYQSREDRYALGIVGEDKESARFHSFKSEENFCV
ncbi:hypothetical protein N0V83_001834 [Neocucurbitaria cava]|uniref:Uncharacterized protein n=1 Tax=Neocucurbitaria cava TaxID=798079 RepID=A0A9W8YF46_9PLEO|nr:hypothetical protein N0V83_001834 [Neocucurbitaria cava]